VFVKRSRDTFFVSTNERLLAEVLEFRKNALEALGQSRGSKALLPPKVLHNIIMTMKANFEEEPEQKQAHARDSMLPESSQTTRRRSRFLSLLCSKFGGLLCAQMILSTGECNSALVDLMNRVTQQVIQTKANRRMEGQDNDLLRGRQDEGVAQAGAVCGQPGGQGQGCLVLGCPSGAEPLTAWFLLVAALGEATPGLAPVPFVQRLPMHGLLAE
jgi:hypothetical protein